MRQVRSQWEKQVYSSRLRNLPEKSGSVGDIMGKSPDMVKIACSFFVRDLLTSNSSRSSGRARGLKGPVQYLSLLRYAPHVLVFPIGSWPSASTPAPDRLYSVNCRLRKSVKQTLYVTHVLTRLHRRASATSEKKTKQKKTHLAGIEPTFCPP